MNTAADIRPDRVAIYIRWSTDDQTEGTTLAVQQEGCEHYVLSQGWRVTPALIFVDDGYSGGSLDRPQMTELRSAVKAGQVDCVVVYKLDRLSRSVIDTVNLVLDEWEGRTYLKSAREPIDTTSPMGKQFFYMLVSYAEWERSVIKERTYSGKVKRVKEGHYWGGIVPYGYRPSGQPGILEIEPAQAEIVQRIFRRYLSEIGSGQIADELNRDGIPAPKGGKWSKVTISLMVKNAFYAGQIKYGKKVINPRYLRNKSEPRLLRNDNPIQAESGNPAIIDENTFVRVQDLIASRRRNTGVRAISSEYLLTGLLRCKCGGAMIAQLTKDGHGRNHTYYYYRCVNKLEQGTTVCNAGAIPQEDLDERVEAELQKLLESQDAYNQFVSLRWATLEAELRETAAQRRQVGKRVDVLQAQAKQLNRDYRAGMRMDLYQENRQEIDEELFQVQSQLLQLERLEQSLTARLHERDSMKEIFDLARRWQEISIPQRKFVLRNLIDEVVAYRVPRKDEIEASVFWKFGGPNSAPAPEAAPV